MKAIKSKWTVFALIGITFLATRLLFLTKLPVFADEAIYIRWAQVGQNEPEKYLFLSMLDGKPPLHNWLIVPFMRVFNDPLLASRLLSVTSGALTLLLLYFCVKLITKSQKYSLLSVLLATLSPFFLINQRMGLAESLLALFFTSGFYFGLMTLKSNKKIYPILFGVSWGLSLWTKTNAVFFATSYALLPLLSSKLSSNKPKKLLSYYLTKPVSNLVMGGILGGLIFLTLKTSELFPFLFSRSQDYTFSVAQIIQGEWKFVLFSTVPRVARWLVWYMTPSTILLFFYESKINKVLASMVLVYTLPMIFLGRILSSRYFFPIAIILIIMAIVGLKNASQNKLDKNITQIFLIFSLIWGAIFSSISIISPDNTWFVAEDRKQYLEDWSSGHGIPQVRDFINTRLINNQVVVATEGYFGTLPDGLMMYFDRTDAIKNLELYGIGQPIEAIPANLFEKAKETEVYVVVNSHRLKIGPDIRIQKVGEYKRPGDSPSLLLLKINPS